MDLRGVLYPLAAEHGLDAGALARLEQLAGFGTEPARLQRRLSLGMGVLAAALLGLGLIFWVAANWESLGRFGRFAVLQGAVLAMGLGALLHGAWRAPLALVVLLASGALFAYYGQTYQTGADAWQLFALWATLVLPLALGVRSELLWTPWVLVSFTAVSLWIQTHTGHRWRVESDDLAVHLVGWGAALILVVAMSTPLRHALGSGSWALRTAATLAVVLVTSTALMGLFARTVAPHYVLGLLALAMLAAAFALRRSFDVFALSAALLGLNVLLVGWLGRLLFEGAGGGDPIGRLFVLGLAAAALLAASVSGVLRLSRAYALRGEAA